MLDLQCTCGWSCQGETKDALLAQVKHHMAGCSFWADKEMPSEGTIRALIAQRARSIDDEVTSLESGLA